MVLVAGRREGAGTANSTTFLPLKDLVGGLPARTLGVITLNFASEGGPPTLMAMVILWGWWLKQNGWRVATKLRGHDRSLAELRCRGRIGAKLTRPQN